MTSAAEPGRAEPGQDYRKLPPSVRLEETVTSVHPDPVPDPDGGQNMEQVRALRDD